MDFTLSDEQLELKELTHQFAANEIRPVAAEYDEKNEFPIEVMKKASDIGFLTSGKMTALNTSSRKRIPGSRSLMRWFCLWTENREKSTSVDSTLNFINKREPGIFQPFVSISSSIISEIATT